MFIQDTEITGISTVKDIVAANYRTSDVFRRYGIEYCCGARWPLTTVCAMTGADETQLISELKLVSRKIEISPLLDYNKWSTEFLAEYILNIYHEYVLKAEPLLKRELDLFEKKHASKYPYLSVLASRFEKLYEKLSSLFAYEEEVLYPYILHLVIESPEILLDKRRHFQMESHSFFSDVLSEFAQIKEILMDIRLLTFDYTPPEKACTSHRVVLAKLRELDTHILQLIHLERDVLFARVLSLEEKDVSETRTSHRL